MLVDVVIQAETSVTGSYAGKMTADLAGLPVPERRYSADVASVMVRGAMFWLLFGQERIGGKPCELRTLIVMKLAAPFAQSFVDNVKAGAAYETLFVTGEGEPLSEILEEPRDTVAFHASFVMTAFNNEEGCLDFFHSSPFAMSDSQMTKKLAVEPVLRVSMSSGLVISLIRDLEAKLDTYRNISAENGNG